MKRITLSALLMVSVGTACGAVQLACYEERGTLKNYCIDENGVTVNGNVRASPLYQGGPKEVERTPYILVTDCARRISTLQDKNGVNFAGGFNNTTELSRSLSQWICAVPKPRQDRKLRQL